MTPRIRRAIAIAALGYVSATLVACTPGPTPTAIPAPPPPTIVAPAATQPPQPTAAPPPPAPIAPPTSVSTQPAAPAQPPMPPPPTVAAPASTGTNPAPAKTSRGVNANTATIAELQAAFTAAGIPNAARWAREVDEYRPYPVSDPGFAKLRRELAKYNPGAETLEKILAALAL